MWVGLLKFLAVLFLNRKASALKDNFLQIRHHMADYTENRALQLKQDFLEETGRLATSLIGILTVFAMFIFTGVLGLMWLFSLLWESPHRSLILGLVMIVPVMIGACVFWAVYRHWKQKPLFESSLTMISDDWHLFRNEMAPKPACEEPATSARQENADEKNIAS